MTQAQSYSYLDLSVHPTLRTHVLSSEATVLFSGVLDAIYWANAAGARLFGGKGVVELLDANLSDDHSFVRQLRSTIGQIVDDRPIIRGFRIAQGLRSALLQFEITPITFADGQRCFKVTQHTESDAAIRGEHARAAAAVESLEGFADAAAIVDDYGLPIATTRDFGRLGPGEDSLLHLTNELKDESDHLIKREIKSESGRAIIAGLGRFSDQPGRNLIVIALGARAEEASTDIPMLNLAVPERVPDTEIGQEQQSVTQDAAPLQPVQPVNPKLTDPDASNDEVSQSDGRSDEIAPDPAHEQNQSKVSEIQDVPKLEEERGVSAEPASSSDEEAPEVMHGLGFSSGEVSEDLDEADEPDTAITSEAIEDHVRFAWTTNASGTITSVSPELGESVGDQAADIVGKKWRDIATIFGFDADETVANLLAGQDTWSGKTVLWPIEGTDMVTPVDLAALPLFDGNREFNGFRGFGIIRSVDAIVDPEELGMALVPKQETRPTKSEDDLMISEAALETENQEAQPKLLWFELESNDAAIPYPDAAEDDTNAHKSPVSEEDKPAENHAGNVVQFFPTKATDQSSELSPRENAAFKKIGDALGDADNADTSSNTAGKTPDTSLISQLPIAVLVYRNDTLLFANEKLLEISGYSNVEDIQENGGLTVLIKASENDDDADTPSILLCQDGTEMPINPVLHSVPWDAEKALQLSFSPPTSLSGVSSEPEADDTEQIHEIQAVLDTTSDGIFLLETNGEIISINTSGEALFNVAFDDVSGKHLTSLFAEESHGTINQYINALSSTGLDGLLQEGREAIASVEGGGEIPVFLAIAKLESSEKLCAVIRDLTSWKKTEQELVKSKRDAERASEQKTDFLAQVSHEVRIPLTAIIGFSDIMIEERFGAINNDRYREYLRDIRKSGQHVLDLVNDLLDLSKIESGKLELAFEAVDLNTAVSESVAMLQAQANENRIIVRTSLSRAVPKVVADERSIRQIILNLVTNAIKFSSSNNQVIVSTVYESNGEVALRIRDTGPGMNEAEIEEAMKPYHQVNRTNNEKLPGTGLGLPLTKALVEANKAYFDLESEPGNGTVVHVQFPIQRVLAD